MADRQSGEKNVAAQHHDEMAHEHDKHDHQLDAEHRQNLEPAHYRETDRMHKQDERQQ